MTEPASSMEFNGDTESEVTYWELTAGFPVRGEYTFTLVQVKPAAPTPALPAVETEPEPVPEPVMPKKHYHLYDVHRQPIGIYRTRTEAVEARSNHLADENTDKYDDDRLVLVGDYEIAVCHRDCSIDGE